MEPKEVRLDTSGIENKEISSLKKTNTSNYLPDGLSFKDFMNDQLNFLSCIPEKETTLISGRVEEIKIEDSLMGSTTNNTTTAKQNTVDSEMKSEPTTTENDRHFADTFLKIERKDITRKDLENIFNLTAHPQFSLNINQTNGFKNTVMNYNNSGKSYTSLNFSKNLSEALEKAYKNNRPIRIDFEKDTSVILKIDKDGKVSAQFLSTDKMMELLLKDNLYLLRAKLDKEGLPYNELNYKDQSGDNKEREKNQNN